MFAGRGTRRARFGVVLVAVVLALTGFSTSGGSSGKKSSSGGGGCSSSKSSKKSSSSSTTKKNYGSGGSATASPTPSASATGGVATAVVASCGDATQPSTTVDVTSLLGRKATFEVSMYREEAGGAIIETASGKITLDARATGTTTIAMNQPGRAGDVSKCRVSAVHVVADASPSASTSTSTSTGGSGTGKPGSKSTPKPTPKATKTRS
ncbi:hypothetical protein [Streptomyces sp. NPDC059564]|uniref:hypothetical protein n=1 Tax=Streptomyces sp. NPDC059564 TaxID=3346865 RepID=UPI0036C8DA90